MALSVKEAITEQGYVFIKSYDADAGTISVASSLGEPMTPWEGGLVQELLPRQASTPNTYSGNYGLGSFPFHTDLAHWRRPPRYLLLRCIRGHSDVLTQLIDGQILLNSELMDILCRAIVKPRRPLGGAVRLLRLCEEVTDSYRLRWDQLFLLSASKMAEIANREVRKQISTAIPISLALTHPGDTLILDNWRMLHSRSSIPNELLDRKIERIYLEQIN